MSRQSRSTIADQTLRIMKAGSYKNSAGKDVKVGGAVAHSVRESRLYTPDDVQRLSKTFRAPELQRNFETQIEVIPNSETTLGAARRMFETCGSVAALNFASAKNPGGGFLTGAQAQEESLARSSALYDTLMAHPKYYEMNKYDATCIYTHHIIYSPDVPVWMNDDGDLLEQFYPCSFITAPAVNWGAAINRAPAALLETELTTRAEFVLGTAAENGVENLILGAWGCGVFRCPPVLVAQIFKTLLVGEQAPFRNIFKRVSFAIYQMDQVRIFSEVFQPDYKLVDVLQQLRLHNHNPAPPQQGGRGRARGGRGGHGKVQRGHRNFKDLRGPGA